MSRLRTSKKSAACNDNYTGRALIGSAFFVATSEGDEESQKAHFGVVARLVVGLEPRKPSSEQGFQTQDRNMTGTLLNAKTGCGHGATTRCNT